MQGGLLRGDSILRHTYSDLEMRRHSSFAGHTKLFDVPYFMSRTNQSKTNTVLEHSLLLIFPANFVHILSILCC